MLAGVGIGLVANQAAGCANALLLPVGMIAIFYLLVWRPQAKQASDLKKFRDGLRKGDAVITAGGLFGRIYEVDGDSVLLELTPSVRVRVLKTQIAQPQPGARTGDEPSGSKEKDKDDRKEAVEPEVLEEEPATTGRRGKRR